jgi:hypothetical protein
MLIPLHHGPAGLQRLASRIDEMRSQGTSEEDIRALLRPVRWNLAHEALLGTLACASGVAASSNRRFSKTPEPDLLTLIERLLPSYVRDRAAWVADIFMPFIVLDVRPTPENVCAVITVIEQESGFNINPVVPDLPKIALREIYDRARRVGISQTVVDSTLELDCSRGYSYLKWIRSARTEKDLSEIYEDFPRKLPLGRTPDDTWNPIRVRGPMRVDLAAAEQIVFERPYPYPVAGRLGDELFTRRGSLYFGIARLLDYPASYNSFLYRFADFRAGQYASRNAAFQNAVAIASGERLVLDGELVMNGGEDAPSRTERALHSLIEQIGLSPEGIRCALARGRTQALEQTLLYQRVFAHADRMQGYSLPRALLPSKELRGPQDAAELLGGYAATSLPSSDCNDAHRQGEPLIWYPAPHRWQPPSLHG